jgi:hypothetical protein
MRVQFNDFTDFVRSEPVVFLLENLIVEVVAQQGNDEPTILVIRHTTSVVALSYQILQSWEGDLLILAHECLQLPSRDAQIGFVEFIGNVPAKSAVLPPFLDDCVEERQSID